MTTAPDNQGDIRPIPDPTALTTAALNQAITGLKEVFDVRLRAMDEATKLLQMRADRVPSEVTMAVEHLKSLHEEKFAGVQQQFRDGKVAVDAALQAAEKSAVATQKSASEAITKSETGANKIIEVLTLRIDDLKERITLIEGKTSGVQSSQSSQQIDKSFFVSIIATLAAITAVVISIVLR